MDHSKTAADVLRGVGGEENVRSLVHCATRLRFVVKEPRSVDDAAVRATTGVITTATAGGQYQVVIGNDVPEVYAEFGKISTLLADAEAGEDAGGGSKTSLFNRFISMISSIFTPLLWTLAGTGLLKAFLAAAVTFGWLSDATTTYAMLNALSDAFIYFLPIALAVTAARHFKASEFTSMAIAGALLYPAMTALVGQDKLTFFGVPFTMVNYVSSVIPIILIVWLQSHAERFLYATLPAAIRRFVTPMIVVLVAVPLVFVVVGPFSDLLSGWLGDGIGWVFDTVPWLGGLLIGGLWQVFVIFGLHWGLVPLFNIELHTNGAIFLVAPVFAAVLAQAAAVAGVWVRTRNRRLKSLAAPATLSGFLAGITEPAIYGINLPLKRPFAFGVAGGAVGGAIISMGGVYSTSFVLPGGLALPALFGNGSTTALVLGLVVAIAIAFLLTVIVGFKDPVDESAPAEGPDPTATANEDGGAPTGDVEVFSPLDGTAVALSEVADPVFSAGTLGQGLAIVPRSGAVYSPVNGTVVTVFPTKHAIGLRSAEGVELLIHIGLDTVKLGGAHFTSRVQDGQDVRVGDLLVEFDVEAIEAAGYDLTTPIVVTNGTRYPAIDAVVAGPIGHGDPLYTAVAESAALATQ